MIPIDEIQIEHYLLAKPETSLYYPFGDDVKVFKVKHKMFVTMFFGKGSEKGTQG